jgi:hypothetical protein
MGSLPQNGSTEACRATNTQAGPDPAALADYAHPISIERVCEWLGCFGHGASAKHCCAVLAHLGRAALPRSFGSSVTKSLI